MGPKGMVSTLLTSRAVTLAQIQSSSLLFSLLSPAPETFVPFLSASFVSNLRALALCSLRSPSTTLPIRATSCPTFPAAFVVTFIAHAFPIGAATKHNEKKNEKKSGKNWPPGFNLLAVVGERSRLSHEQWPPLLSSGAMLGKCPFSVCLTLRSFRPSVFPRFVAFANQTNNPHLFLVATISFPGLLLSYLLFHMIRGAYRPIKHLLQATTLVAILSAIGWFLDDEAYQDWRISYMLQVSVVALLITDLGILGYGNSVAFFAAVHQKPAPASLQITYTTVLAAHLSLAILLGMAAVAFDHVVLNSTRSILNAIVIGCLAGHML
jgi:hypothetical protein